MPDEIDEAVSRIAVEVADDRMQAWVRSVDSENAEPLTVEEVVTAMEEAELSVTDEVRVRCSEFLATLGGEEDQSEPFLVAEGHASVEPQDGEFTYHESFEQYALDWRDDAPADWYSYNSIVTVEKDMPIGTVTPAVLGEDGVNVFGNVLKVKGVASEVDLDSSVRRCEEDPQVVLASTPGKVIYANGRVLIEEVFEVKGDVDFECGHIDSSVIVSIQGTILDLFKVMSKKSIQVRGAIQAATIEAQEDVLVRGGVLGRGGEMARHRGTVKVGGQIIAKFAEEADLQAIGDIKIAKEMMNSRVHTMGHLRMPQGAMIGGDVYAREGVEAGALGSDACVATRIVVGIDPRVLREVDRINKSQRPKRRSVERIREGLKPLMAEMKRLSPAQKEQITELLFKAETMEEAITEVESRRDKMVEEARADGIPFVLVSKLIHPGVSIRIGRRLCVFNNEYKGPVRIEKRKVKGVTEFVAVNMLSGSITVLASEEVVEEANVGESEEKDEPGSKDSEQQG